MGFGIKGLPFFRFRIVLVLVLLATIHHFFQKNTSPLASLLSLSALLLTIWIITDSILFYLYQKRSYFSFFFLIFIICFVFIETSLRYLTNHYLTYFEQIQNRYLSYYDIYQNNQLSYPANDTLFFSSKGEYGYSFTTNSKGYCDKEWTLEKARNEYRILCLGDSFTLGMGAPQDSTWVKSFEQHYRGNTQLVYTLNAGVTGSDIINENYKLKTRFIQYQPDAVILCLNASDIVDIYLRGGNERFDQPEKSRAISPLGRLESLYQVCFLYRVWIHVVQKRDFLFLSPSDYESIGEQSMQIIQSELMEIKQFCTENGIDFFFVLHPHGFEIKNNNYMYSHFAEVRYGKEGYSSDLMSDFSDVERPDDIFHQRDRHFNSKGYTILGKLIADHFLKMHENLN